MANSDKEYASSFLLEPTAASDKSNESNTVEIETRE